MMFGGGNLSKKYKDDPRTACQFGMKCYQKNEAHRKKYKHPPAIDETQSPESQTKKRTWLDRKENNKALSSSSDADSDSDLHQVKKTCVSQDTSEENEGASSAAGKKMQIDNEKNDVDSVVASHSKSYTEDNEDETSMNNRKLIKDKFLVEMPDDFYKFYEFCKEILPSNPSRAFKFANLVLVGPYDVLNGKLLNAEIEDEELYLRHWRYFYDPPEFQTVIRGNDKDGLHFGYWRDDPKEKPIFVAKNCSNIDCKIKPIAGTIFGAVDLYLEERLKTITPFERSKFTNLRSKLRKYALSKYIELDKSTDSMRARERQVVARTFHGAGIVVPYDKKTQLGYRELAATDSNLKKILSHLDEAEDEVERSKELVHLEEVERLATIAADECDFGTCLELGHDLFSSGSKYVRKPALRMLSTAYNLLNRLEFMKIAEAHDKNRKKGSDLSIV